jgi:hypothetical protein
MFVNAALVLVAISAHYAAGSSNTILSCLHQNQQV